VTRSADAAEDSGSEESGDKRTEECTTKKRKVLLLMLRLVCDAARVLLNWSLSSVMQNWFAETTLLIALIKDVRQLNADKVKNATALARRMQQVTAYQSIPRSNFYR
jgi:hypothetical protein